MTSGSEISRLLDVMPASGRMYCKIVSSNQPKVIAAKLPRPGQETRPILINFDLWQQLTQPQRDLLLLHTVSWLLLIRWVKPDLYQGLVAAGIAGTLLELFQGNTAAVVTLGGLTTLAAAQIWRKNRSIDLETAADEKAVQIAQRRGYTAAVAAQSLVEAIAAVAKIEGRANLSFNETLRCQNIRKLTSPAPFQGSDKSTDQSQDASQPEQAT
ncbi:MAG: DUF3318 domain-containing protein [Cyanobacteria bacterium RM1_2_2]|nr:DUF3318 domain-containing protein [Cyanobacteria bacterium RM1_2_2]